MDQAILPIQQPSASHRLRCAVYTRTSHDGAELAFDSIEAQRDACLAYIASQRSQGWLAPPSSLDDPGVSGATLKRPSLARMLAAIESGLVDVVVVYKIDRLSRSLADFSSLMQLFDRHGVGLVSVTQHLNSLDAAGRLGINTLMAFAQFERENAAERTRDKLRATRRQGLWAGGVPPMGYKVVNQRLQVLPDEAAVVRRIFERFVALGSITELVSELNEQGVTTKLLISQAGRSRGGQRFDKSYLYKVIKNRTLTGEIKSGQTWYPGQHLPIVSAELWAQAQAMLSLRRRARKTGIDKPQALMLKGLVFGTDGRAYSPCRSSLQNGRSYSYYIPQRKIAEGARATDLPTCPAGELETVVVEHVRKTLRNPGTLLDALPAAIKQHPGYSNDAATAALASIDGIWDELFYPFVRAMVHQLVERITIGTASIKIALKLEGLGKAVLSLLPGGSSALVGSGHQNALLHEPTPAKYGQKITKIRKTGPPDLGRKSQEVVSKIGFETPFSGESPEARSGA